MKIGKRNYLKTSLSLFVFAILACSSLMAMTNNVCAAIFTFDPLIIENQCLTDDFFVLLKQTLEQQSDGSPSIATKIDDLGGKWSLSKIA